MPNLEQLSAEPLVAAFVLQKAKHESPELQAKLLEGLSVIIQDTELARKLKATADHARALISEVEQLQLAIGSSQTTEASR